MPKPRKINNDYWMDRLKKDGHFDVIKRIEAKEITMYKARGLVGYRKIKPTSVAGKLSYHWKRASADERRRFVGAHPLEIDRSLKEFVAEHKT
jgi:hypothetical protein